MSNGTRYNPDEWQVTHCDRDVRCVVNVITGEERMIDAQGYFVKGPGAVYITVEVDDQPMSREELMQIPVTATRMAPQRI